MVPVDPDLDRETRDHSLYEIGHQIGKCPLGLAMTPGFDFETTHFDANESVIWDGDSVHVVDLNIGRIEH